MSNEIDFKRAYDAAYPVLEAVRKLNDHYLGNLDGQARIAPDAAGELFEALAKCDATYGLREE